MFKFFVVLSFSLSIPAQFLSPINFIPASAHAEGGYGTFWKTNLSIYNPNQQKVKAYIYLIKSNISNNLNQVVNVDIPANQSIDIEDVLYSKFNYTGAAALIITSMDIMDYINNGTQGLPILVSSRTFTPDPVRPPGSYGQGISASVIPNFGTSYVTGIAQNSNYRTNLGVFTIMGMGYGYMPDITINAEIYDSSNNLKNTLTFKLPALSQAQQNINVNIDKGYAIFKAQPIMGFNVPILFFGYASRVDNSTGDAVYLPASINPNDLESQEEEECKSTCEDLCSS